MKILGGALMTTDTAFRTLERRGRFGAFADLNAARKALLTTPGIPQGDLGDFGRGGPAVRKVMLTALLAAWDAGGELPGDTGVVGWNGDGCTSENLAYWQDYSDCGRTAGRGGLFVSTLPTIPYCEAAIALGCHGAVAYLRTAEDTSCLADALGAAAPGTYLCGELAHDAVCVLFADTRTAGAALPRRRTLAELFGRLEADK